MMLEHAVMLTTVPPAEPLDVTPWLPYIAGAILAIIGGIFGITNRRGGERARRTPTWVEYATENRLLRADLGKASEEAKATRKEFESLTSDLTDLRREFEDFAEEVEAFRAVNSAAWRAAHDQWPAGSPAPSFDHIPGLDVIDDTLPPAWRRASHRP